MLIFHNFASLPKGTYTTSSTFPTSRALLHSLHHHAFLHHLRQVHLHHIHHLHASASIINFIYITYMIYVNFNHQLHVHHPHTHTSSSTYFASTTIMNLTYVTCIFHLPQTIGAQQLHVSHKTPKVPFAQSSYVGVFAEEICGRSCYTGLFF